MANGIRLKLNHWGKSRFALIQICIEPKSVYLFCEGIKGRWAYRARLYNPMLKDQYCQEPTSVVCFCVSAWTYPRYIQIVYFNCKSLSFWGQALPSYLALVPHKGTVLLEELKGVEGGWRSQTVNTTRISLAARRLFSLTPIVWCVLWAEGDKEGAGSQNVVQVWSQQSKTRWIF